MNAAVTNPFSSISDSIMDDLVTYDALLFPADGRQPHLVELMTSPVTQTNPQTGQLVLVSVMPHPEVHMDGIAEGQDAGVPWRYQIIESLDGMTRSFANPYILFYPVRPRPGTFFPLNKAIREIQGIHSEQPAWKGNIVIAKYRGGADDPFMALLDATMADFPILKNFLSMSTPPSTPTVRIA
ncbi:hypothetical protein BD410DRAFT_834050 [Rickenella mellea]|uniref:Uncharacterized protein n=1 Tax=Rickenella mellea TaxID=50990 RepID=A0A4R5XF61_9AGAM|nr:hypothetical protein BD410DRAFT_834050 [Rickenella mellea]